MKYLIAMSLIFSLSLATFANVAPMSLEEQLVYFEGRVKSLSSDLSKNKIKLEASLAQVKNLKKSLEVGEALLAKTHDKDKKAALEETLSRKRNDLSKAAKNTKTYLNLVKSLTENLNSRKASLEAVQKEMNKKVKGSEKDKEQESAKKS